MARRYDCDNCEINVATVI